jgi:hypothetical protein
MNSAVIICSPIPTPNTFFSKDTHRVQISIPNGIEFETAEVDSASTKASGAIALDLKDSYGQFNLLRHSGAGAVH